jgi:CheY-like chemotaxis protein
MFSLLGVLKLVQRGTHMSKTILVAEDTEDSRYMMRYILELCGYDVIEAEDGSEAVKKFRQEKPDLVLMDISMPVMDGLTATRIIREKEGTTKLPIFAVTAHGNGLYKEAIAAGCNEVIPKPVIFETLQPVIEKYLSKYQVAV